MKLSRTMQDWAIVLFIPKPIQARAFASRAWTVVASGGNQAGKTIWLVCKILAASMGFHPWLSPDHPDYLVRDIKGRPIQVPNRGRLIVVDFPNGIHKNFLPKFQEYAPPGTIYNKNSQGYICQAVLPWGSVIDFMTNSQESKVHESATPHWVGYDEPPEREVLIANRRGLMRWSGPEWLAMTPLDQPYMAEAIYNQADGRTVEIFEFPTEDNLETHEGGVLGVEAFQRFENTLTPAEKLARLKGGLPWQHGRCVPSFQDREPWVCEPVTIGTGWPRVMVLDPHVEKPEAILWWTIRPDGERSYVYADVMDDTTRLAHRSTANRIREIEANTGGVACFRLIDPRAGSVRIKSTERTVMEEYASHGIHCEQAPPIGLQKGFKQVNGWFQINPEDPEGKPFCQVFDTCHLTIAHLMSTKWMRQRKGYELRPRPEGDDDMVACLRYLATWGPTLGRLRPYIEESVKSDYDPVEEARASYRARAGLDQKVVHDKAPVLSGTHTGY